MMHIWFRLRLKAFLNTVLDFIFEHLLYSIVVEKVQQIFIESSMDFYLSQNVSF